MQIAMMTPNKGLHHHWGHSNVPPWSHDGTLMLSQRVDVSDMQELLEGRQALLDQQLGFVNFTAGESGLLVLHCVCGRRHSSLAASLKYQTYQVMLIRGACLCRLHFDVRQENGQAGLRWFGVVDAAVCWQHLAQIS